MKKSLSFLLVIALVFGMFSAMASAATPTATEAGQKLQTLGVIKGDGSSLMENEIWKRQDVIILLSRLLGKEEVALATPKSHTYADVPADAGKYDNYLSWAREAGLVQGHSATKFGWNEELTVEQFAAIVLRALGKDTTGANFANTATWAVELGLYPAGTDFKASATRGSTYVTIVGALDTKLPNGKKLGAELGFAGYESAVELTATQAINQNTVKLTFNQDVAAFAATAVKVIEKDDIYAIKAVSKVSVEKNVATVTLDDKLATDKTYTITATGVASAAEATVVGDVSADFTFAKAAPASIAFKATTVADSAKVEVIVKDADGNDISSNYDLTPAGDITVESSDNSVVNESTLVATSADTSYSVVNVKLTYGEDGEKTLETGNTIITVKKTLLVPTTIERISLDADKDVSTIDVGDTGTVYVKVLDQNGTVIATPEEITLISQSPAIVSADSASGTVYGAAAGNATIIVKAKFNGITISKTFVVTVRKPAEATSIKIDKTSLALVAGSEIGGSYEVSVLDQYGEVFKAANGTVTLSTTSTSNPFEVNNGQLVKGTNVDVVVADGKAKFNVDAIDAGTPATSISLKFNYVGEINKTVSATASVVVGGALVGYIVEAEHQTLNLVDPLNSKYDADNDFDSTVLHVYAKDSKGYKLYEVPANRITLVADTDKVSVATNVVTAEKVGTQTVKVLVDSANVTSIAITVKDTSAGTLSKVTQAKNSVSVAKNGDAQAAVFGAADDGKGALVGYDQYGTKVAFQAADLTIVSSNSSVVSVANKNEITAVAKGSATLTIIINSNVYVVVVNVTE